MFWADYFSLLEPGILGWESVLGSRQVTDVYPLALALRNEGRLVTFDRTLPRRAVQGSKPEYLIVP
jgi:hypothetical protein